MLRKNWICRILGHNFKYLKPWFICERCGYYVHNPYPPQGYLATPFTTNHAMLINVTADQHHNEDHEVRHVLGGADAIDSALNALAIALTTHGDIVYHAAAANTLARLAPGVAGQSLLTGGPAANPSWGAPAPAGHEATHVLAGADAIDSALDARALALVNQGDIVYRALAANTLAALAPGVAGQALLTGGAGANPSWGAPAPAAHLIDGVLHTAAGLTIGHTIRATGAAAFAFAQLQHADLGGVTSDLHHAQSHEATHVLGGADAIATPLALAAIPLHSATKHTDTVIVGKPADETVNNSEVLQDDDHIVLAVEVDEVWIFQLLMICNSTSDADIKIGFSVPANTTMMWGPITDTKFATTEAEIEMQACLGVDLVKLFAGVIRVGDTAGNVVLQWAQDTADASDTKMLKGTGLLAIKSA